MKFLHKFETVSAFTAAYNGTGYTEPWVSYVEETSISAYNKKPVHVTMRLYYVDLYETNESVTSEMWENAITGTPVESQEFNSPEEFMNYHFVKTSPDPIMYICFGSTDSEYVDGAWQHSNFQNNMSRSGASIDMTRENVSYISINENLYDGYKQFVLDYVTEHGEINVLYASYNYYS